ncbi:MAG: SRPBCC family protein [Nocardioidaceae bacterium]
MSSGFVRESVDIDASRGRVWDHVVDWPGQSEWIPATRVRGVTGSTGIGTQIEAFTGVGPFGLVDTMTVTAWDPPHRCEVLHTGRVLRGEAGFVVTPRGDDGARLEWWERFDLPAGPVGRLAWPAARPVVLLGLRRALQTLRRRVES